MKLKPFSVVPSVVPSVNLSVGLSVGLALFVVAGCGGADDTTLVFYKPAGSLQCAASRTTQVRLDIEVAALRAAGAAVLSRSCANDGAARLAVCGADNGDLLSVSVDLASVPTTLLLGYQPAASYPTARTIACQ